ncbi:thioredoxin-disulfide reductase [uncultured Muribaculum sp.]|uniref:thioredoxin-disulfide reductase n=2 Tax=uncultured Muribaculum sp. TaxID=1918613 RepID=UPI0025B1C664|nr:thioredoxin-disulfide reductase [uncultured Muribaculum sp.]
MFTSKTKCLIIGSGPAGYTAAIYASRANMEPILYEGTQPGGQLTTTSEVENFPGYPEGVMGSQLMDDLRRQAERFGTQLRQGTVTAVNFDERPFKITDDSGDTVTADTVIIATGASAKYLGLPDESRFAGLGVSACATCDGFFYRGRTVAVVGGGDTACEEALYLSNLAKKVYLIVRKDYLRASKVMQKRVFDKDNIEVCFETVTKGLFGTEFLEGAHLLQFANTEQQREFDIAIDGFFLAIGHKPNTELFSRKLDMDSNGYIVLPGTNQQTSIAGVFAAGDVADPHYQQAICAAASGCKAALDAERFIMENS